MSWAFIIIGSFLLISSYLFCVLPIIPGPILAYLGLLALYATNYHPSILALLVSTVVVIVACVLDYVVPALSAKKFRCSKWGVFGCFLGSLLGFFLGTIISLFCTIIVGAMVLVLSMLVVPFLGTVIGELCAERSFKQACWGGLGSLIGNVIAVGMKLFACFIVTIIFLWTWIAA